MVVRGVGWKDALDAGMPPIHSLSSRSKPSQTDGLAQQQPPMIGLYHLVQLTVEDQDRDLAAVLSAHSPCIAEFGTTIRNTEKSYTYMTYITYIYICIDEMY